MRRDERLTDDDGHILAGVVLSSLLLIVRFGVQWR
jgi:hypothetical protein